LARELIFLVRAIGQCLAYMVAYRAWKRRSTTVQPPPVRPDQATQLRAIVGCGCVALATGFLGTVLGFGPVRPNTAPVGVAKVADTKSDTALPWACDKFWGWPSAADAVEEPESEPSDQAATEDSVDSAEGEGWHSWQRFADEVQQLRSSATDAAEPEPGTGQLAGPVEEDRDEQREIGVRVPIGVPRPSGDYGRRTWSTAGRQASAPAYNDWGAAARRAAQADYARQRAIEQAQYQSDRAMRNYQQQTSGQFGAMGLQWTPSGYGP
jgi:hypothetical protein